MLHDVQHVLVELSSDEPEIGEDERLLDVEAKRNDVLGVLDRQLLALF